MPIKNVSRHIVEMDTFRAWAILSVLLFHYFKEFYPGEGFLIRFGWSGVDLFFVISGFVMYLQIGRKYIAGGRIQLRKYLINRFLRIAPAFYTSLLAEVLILHRDKLFSKEFFMHLSFTHAFSYDVAFSIQPVYWTLAVEVQFYLFLILAARFLTGKRAWLSLSSLMCLSLLYRYAVSHAYGFSHTGVLLINQLPGRLVQFVPGMALARMYMNKDLMQSLRRKAPYLFLSGMVLYILCGLYWLKGGDGIFDNVVIETVFHPLLGLTFGMIMASLLGREGRAGALLRLRPLVLIGLVSYSLYLWHMFLLEVINVTGVRHMAVPSVLIMTLALAVAIGMATVSYILVEKQFLKLKAR